jgi:hypothetical protein
LATSISLAATSLAAQPAKDKPVAVNAFNFARAETDMYFAKLAKDGGFGKLRHRRAPVAIDKQDVVRMNRDTLYSNGVFDLDAAPVTITLPDTSKRFTSMQVVSEDHYTPEVVYAPGQYTYTKEKVGTRYVQFIIRTLADPQDAADVKAANAMQDAIKVEQASVGKFEVPNWDPVTLNKARDAVNTLGTLGGASNFFGKKDEVDLVSFLIGTAGGWGGSPSYAAIYLPVWPKPDDAKTVQRLTVKDVPVDGFWSISVYDKAGFFAKNDLGTYSLNSITAKPAADGSYTVQFGGCTKATSNCLPITDGWNYIVRLYRPRAEVRSGSWKFPEARPVK